MDEGSDFLQKVPEIFSDRRINGLRRNKNAFWKNGYEMTFTVVKKGDGPVVVEKRAIKEIPIIARIIES